MKFEIIPTKGVLYDKCENVEQLYDNFYFPLLVEFKELQQENKQLKEQIKEIKEYIYDFIKHSSYGKKEIDEAIHQEFYNIMLIIKYAKEELKGSDKE